MYLQKPGPQCLVISLAFGESCRNENIIGLNQLVSSKYNVQIALKLKLHFGFALNEICIHCTEQEFSKVKAN